MEGQFKVGEIAIIQNAINDHTNNGTEVEIVGGLGARNTRFIDGERVITCYVTKTKDGVIWNCMPHQLRRRPPKQDHSEWAAKKVRDLLLTQPKEVA